MISKKDNYGNWYNSENQHHKFSGPYYIYSNSISTYCQNDFYHRLYGFAWDWKNNLSWCVNNKSLNEFKGLKDGF